VAPALLKLPLFGDFLRVVGAVPCDAKGMSKALKGGKTNMFIIPGGLAEMFHTADPTEVAHIANRQVRVLQFRCMLFCYTLLLSSCTLCCLRVLVFHTADPTELAHIAKPTGG
jgi:hypothetical protein